MLIRERGTGNGEQGTGKYLLSSCLIFTVTCHLSPIPFNSLMLIRERGTGNGEQGTGKYLLSSCLIFTVTCHLSPVTCHLFPNNTSGADDN